MKNIKGQTAVEMVFVLPLLIMLAAGMLFMVYAGWQNLKVQQAANVAARIEGQEKVGGGVSDGSIDQENGFHDNPADEVVNTSVNDSVLEINPGTQASVGSGGTVFSRMQNMVQSFFLPRDGAKLLAPRTGQNVDKITVYRVLQMPHLPFMKSAGVSNTLVLQGTAYGGEDSYMYALPRWGTTPDSQGSPEWRNLLKSAAQQNSD